MQPRVLQRYAFLHEMIPCLSQCAGGTGIANGLGCSSTVSSLSFRIYVVTSMRVAFSEVIKIT